MHGCIKTPQDPNMGLCLLYIFTVKLGRSIQRLKIIKTAYKLDYYTETMFFYEKQA